MDWNEYWKTRNPSAPDIDMVRYFSQISDADKRILEVGCGNGINLDWLCDHFGDVYGIDSSEEACLKNFHLDSYNESIEEFSKRNEKFDYIVDIECLCACSENDLKLVAGMLNQGGKLFSKWFLEAIHYDICGASMFNPLIVEKYFDIRPIEKHDRYIIDADPGNQAAFISEIIWEGTLK